MMKVVKAFKWSIGFAMFLLGLLFVASDIGDVPDAVQAWRKVFAMIEQNTALWVFSIAALAYIVWIDARPYIAKWRKGESSDISVGENLYWETVLFEVEGETFYKNLCYLHVYNAGRRRRTARKVRVRTYSFGSQHEARTKSGALDVDLHHGEVESFFLGALVSGTPYGFWNHNAEITETDRAGASKGVPSGSYSFNMAEKHGIGFSTKIKPGSYTGGQPLSMLVTRVSAEDIPTLEVSFRLLMEAVERAADDTSIRSPIEIVDVTEI